MVFIRDEQEKKKNAPKAEGIRALGDREDAAANEENLRTLRGLFEDELRAHLNQRTNAVQLVNSQRGMKSRFGPVIVSANAPASLREARAALALAYNVAVGNKANIGAPDRETIPHDHHDHDHHPVHVDDLHPRNHHEDEAISPGERHCRQIEQHMLEVTGDEHHKKHLRAMMHKLEIPQNIGGRGLAATSED